MLQREGRARADGPEPPLRQPMGWQGRSWRRTGRDSGQNNPASSSWHLGTDRQPLQMTAPLLFLVQSWPGNEEVNIYVLVGRPSLERPGQDLEHDSKRIQCQQHVMLIISVVLAIKKDVARKPRPAETWGDFPISASQHPPVTQTLTQSNPTGWVAWKKGREGRQLAHHGAVLGRRKRRRGRYCCLGKGPWAGSLWQRLQG